MSELLLPILYIDVPGLAEDSPDEVVALLARTQYERWTDLRFESEDSPAYRRAVNGLATRLRDIAEAVNALPDSTTPEVAELAFGDEMGILDSAVIGEEVVPQWVAALELLSGIMHELNPIVADASNKMEKSPSSGAKLIAAQQFAKNMSEPSGRYRATAAEYGSKMVEIDPAILRMIRGAEEAREAGEDVGDFVEFFGVVKNMVQEFRSLAREAEEFVQSLESASRVSRAVRPPLRDLRAGTQQIIDGQSILEEWNRKIDETGLLH